MNSKSVLWSVLKILSFRLLISISIWLLFAPNNYSQWNWQNPLPQGNSLTGLYFTDSNNGWAVGTGGTLLRTNNGGDKWSLKNFSPDYDFKSISFADYNCGMVAGGNNGTGIILYTTNGGDNWSVKLFPNSSILHGIAYINPDKAITVGEMGNILKTTNGGESWFNLNSGVTNALASVAFYDTSLGIAAGRNILLRTTNGGINWVDYTPFISSDFQINSIKFIDSNHITAVGTYGIIIKSTDKGISWAQKYSPTDSHLYTVSFTDSLNGSAAGGFSPWDGVIIHTTDGGNIWKVQLSDSLNWNIFSILFTDINHGVAVGGLGIIYRTTDSGNNWISEYNSLGDQFWGVSFSDANNGVVVGTDIYRTSDGGNSWIKPETTGDYYGLLNVQLINSTGTAVGNNGRIFRTTDGGIHWFSQTSGTTKLLRKVCFTDVNNGTICGDFGIILRTSNGGDTWIPKPYGTTNLRFEGVSFTDANTGTIVCPLGYIIRTTDGGNSWTKQMYGDFAGVFFIDKDNGWVIKRDGGVIHTTNGGNSWTNQYSGTTVPLYEIKFIDINNGWITGRETILHTTDGGNHWIKQPCNAKANIEDISMIDPLTGTVVGDGGVILHTTNGGVSFAGRDEGFNNPKGFYLYQNYPNPFNPSTRIKIQLFQRMSISLCLFDLLGRKIKTIFEGEKQAGEHSFVISGTDLPSGIYIYRLNTISGSESKKLILVK